MSNDKPLPSAPARPPTPITGVPYIRPDMKLTKAQIKAVADRVWELLR